MQELIKLNLQVHKSHAKAVNSCWIVWLFVRSKKSSAVITALQTISGRMEEKTTLARWLCN